MLQATSPRVLATVGHLRLHHLLVFIEAVNEKQKFAEVSRCCKLHSTDEHGQTVQPQGVLLDSEALVISRSFAHPRRSRCPNQSPGSLLFPIRRRSPGHPRRSPRAGVPCDNKHPPGRRRPGQGRGKIQQCRAARTCSLTLMEKLPRKVMEQPSHTAVRTLTLLTRLEASSTLQEMPKH